MRRIITTIALTAIVSLTAHGEYVTPPEGLRLRKSPSLDAEVIEVLPFGTEVTGTIKEGWMKTKVGYLKAEHLSESDPLEQYEHCGSWLLTAYTHTGLCCADGTYPEAGYTVACNSLPMGTELYIEGIGFRTVCDRGPSSMPDEWCDIFMDSHEECVAFGEQHHEVWITKMP